MRRTIVFELLLAGCGASSSPIMAPDGSRGWLIECRHSGQCYDEAAELCPSGYVVFDRQGHVKGYVHNEFGTIPVNAEELMIQCRKRER